MSKITLEENQIAEAPDAAVHAALDEGEAAISRGEVVDLELSRVNARARYKAWLERTQNLAASSR